MLEAFVRFLVDIGVVGREEPADIDRMDDETSRIMHCVVIAGRLGLEHGCVFDRLCRGPYSENLSIRIQEVVPRVRAWLAREAPPPLPAGFDRGRFARLVAGKDDVWIEVAARLIIFSQSRRDAETLVEWYGEETEGRSVGLCRSIVREMTSPEIGIVLDFDKYRYDRPWEALVASATRRPIVAPPVPAAAR